MHGNVRVSTIVEQDTAKELYNSDARLVVMQNGLPHCIHRAVDIHTVK